MVRISGPSQQHASHTIQPHSQSHYSESHYSSSFGVRLVKLNPAGPYGSFSLQVGFSLAFGLQLEIEDQALNEEMSQNLIHSFSIPYQFHLLKS